MYTTFSIGGEDSWDAQADRATQILHNSGIHFSDWPIRYRLIDFAYFVGLAAAFLQFLAAVYLLEH